MLTMFYSCVGMWNVGFTGREVDSMELHSLGLISHLVEEQPYVSLGKLYYILSSFYTTEL